MHITAKVDYAVRAVLEIAAADGTVSGGELAEAQDLPVKFLGGILATLTKAGILVSHRGPTGGYALARDAAAIPVADIVRAIDGPLAAVRGMPPEDVAYPGAAAPLRDVWVAARAGLRLALESVTIADMRAGDLPAEIRDLLRADGAYRRR